MKALLVLGFILLNALLLIWAERKVAGHIQQRPGLTVLAVRPVPNLC